METLNDVIALWTVQLKEHAMFIFMLLDEKKAPNLKSEANRQWKKWSNIQLKPIVEALPNAILELNALKQKVLDTINAGAEIGNIYPSLIEHMLKESNFFLGKLQQNITIDKEIEFWVMENAEHTGLTGHLLDPIEKQLVIDSLNMSQDLEEVINADLGTVNQLYQESNDAALELEGLLQKNQVKTVNNPMTLLMLQHEIREATYGAERLKTI